MDACASVANKIEHLDASGHVAIRIVIREPGGNGSCREEESQRCIKDQRAERVWLQVDVSQWK